MCYSFHCFNTTFHSRSSFSYSFSSFSISLKYLQCTVLLILSVPSFPFWHQISMQKISTHFSRFHAFSHITGMPSLWHICHTHQYSQDKTECASPPSLLSSDLPIWFASSTTSISMTLSFWVMSVGGYTGIIYNIIYKLCKALIKNKISSVCHLILVMAV